MNQNNKQITISLEEVISNMDITKEQKEELYRRASQIPESDGTIIWEGDRIKGMQLNKLIEYVDITIKIPSEDKAEVL